ncbi:hypothetical protein, partial [Paraburkholderia podalyriae]|uniref:hypothetical protein n=1 Tax=Paraburkholderia podalyriae TaxID=1938811 RepID=UPI001CA3DAD4
FAFKPFSRANLATDTPDSQAAIARRRRNSGLWFGRPLRLPGLRVGSDKMVSTTSKMMDITLMPILAPVYDGHREPLTVKPI